MATEVMAQLPEKPEALIPSESELKGLLKLQRMWEEKIRSRKTGKTFFSGSLSFFLQSFPRGHHRLDEISYQRLSPHTVEKHIECLLAVGILEKDKKKRLSLSPSGKKVAGVLNKYGQCNLEEHILRRLGEVKREHSRKPVDISRELRAKLCSHCKYMRADSCLYRGHCERQATFL